MPPKRNRRTPRPQQLQEQSDYDSETLHTDTAPPTAAPDTVVHPPIRTNEELNLTVLKRHNPQIQQVLSVAPFAVVYIFSSTTQSWEKTGVEGTLFVCQLIPAVIYHGEEGLVVERYSVLVLNRKGLENFNTELHTSADVEITDEYVILQVDRDGQGEEPAIYGLWIFSEPGASTEHTRVVNAKVMMECASRSEQSREAANTATMDENGYDEEREEEYHEEQGQQNGYNHEPSAQHHDHPHAGYDHHDQRQQLGEQQGQHSNQQVNLLSLFGKSSAQTPTPQHNGPGQSYNNGYQQPQQQHDHQQQQLHKSPLPGYLPHSHPQQMHRQQPMQMQMQMQMQQQMPQHLQSPPQYVQGHNYQHTPQPTQAQNLLSLFKR
ncbi:hypothetical protein ANO11243_047320 [Dothideomycetidae sp. 11243]|nr:hypothetical protein ANO11243_047320 [fungal sp. No.11243]